MDGLGLFKELARRQHPARLAAYKRYSTAEKLHRPSPVSFPTQDLFRPTYPRNMASSSSAIGPASSKGKQPQRGAAFSSSSAPSGRPHKKSRIENLRAALNGFSELLDAAAT